MPVSWALSDGWSLTVAPSVDWFGEKSASNSESRVWGAMVSGVKQCGGGNRLGVGLGVYDQIEKTSVFPVVIVDWRLNDWLMWITPPCAVVARGGVFHSVRCVCPVFLGRLQCFVCTCSRMSALRCVATARR